MGGKLVHLVNGNAKEGSHLVDECTRSACAGTVHSLLGAACKEDDLCVLTAKLDNAVSVGIIMLYGDERTVYLLHERQRSGICKSQTCGACDSKLEACIGEHLSYLFYLLCSGLTHL